MRRSEKVYYDLTESNEYVELLETRLQELKKYLEKLLEDRSYVDELLTKTVS